MRYGLFVGSIPFYWDDFDAEVGVFGIGLFNHVGYKIKNQKSNVALTTFLNLFSALFIFKIDCLK